MYEWTINAGLTPVRMRGVGDYHYCPSITDEVGGVGRYALGRSKLLPRTSIALDSS